MFSLAASGEREGRRSSAGGEQRLRIPAVPGCARLERSGLPWHGSPGKRSAESNEKAGIAYRLYLDVLARCVYKNKSFLISKILILG